MESARTVDRTVQLGHALAGLWGNRFVGSYGPLPPSRKTVRLALSSS